MTGQIGRKTKMKLGTPEARNLYVGPEASAVLVEELTRCRASSRRFSLVLVETRPNECADAAAVAGSAHGDWLVFVYARTRSSLHGKT